MINPIEHSRTKEAANKYKVEPYVVSADVYTQKNLAGRGGWTWYTGSSSWMYEAGIKYLLGLHIENGYLILEIGYDQKEDVENLLKENKNYSEIKTIQDFSGNDRCTIAKVGKI